MNVDECFHIISQWCETNIWPSSDSTVLFESLLQMRTLSSLRSPCLWCRSWGAVWTCAAALALPLPTSAGDITARSCWMETSVWCWGPAASSSPRCPIWPWGGTSVWPAPVLEPWPVFLLTSQLPVSRNQMTTNTHTPLANLRHCMSEKRCSMTLLYWLNPWFKLLTCLELTCLF